MEMSAVKSLIIETARLTCAETVTETEGQWKIQWTDDSRALVVHDSILPRIVITLDVQPLPHECPPRFLEMLLAYNYLWDSHGGVRTALDCSRNMVALMLDIPTEDVTAQTLVRILDNMRETLNDWHEIFQTPDASASHDASDVYMSTSMNCLRP